jgi:hypothetical protein
MSAFGYWNRNVGDVMHGTPHGLGNIKIDRWK